MPEDRFDQVRSLVWGTPGFEVKRSTIVAPGSTLLPQASYIVETLRNEEGWTILVQSMSAEGGSRIVLPDRVARTLFRHYEALMQKARKARAVRAAETRLRKTKQ